MAFFAAVLFAVGYANTLSFREAAYLGSAAFLAGALAGEVGAAAAGAATTTFSTLLGASFWGAVFLGAVFFTAGFLGEATFFGATFFAGDAFFAKIRSISYTYAGHFVCMFLSCRKREFLI